MAVLNKDEFFNTLHNHIGSDTSEESLTFLENMTDTYNDLAGRASGDGIDWHERYNELDKTWRDKYRHRFFTSDGGNYNPPNNDVDEDEYNPSSITYDSLFKANR